MPYTALQCGGTKGVEKCFYQGSLHTEGKKQTHSTGIKHIEADWNLQQGLHGLHSFLEMGGGGEGERLV